MATQLDKQLEKLMNRKWSGVDGSSEALDLAAMGESIDEIIDIQAASFNEPFWDELDAEHAYRPDGTPLDPEGSPTYAPNPWDRVQLSQHLLPGLWTASATPAIKLDVQKPLGFDGAAIISRGYLPAGITLTGQIWTREQWGLLLKIIPAIWRAPFKVASQDVQLDKKGKVGAVEKDQGEIVGEQRSLGIVTPALNAIGIFYVVVRQITPLVPSAIIGVRQMTIECVEYVPEPPEKKSAVKKAEGQSTRGKNAFDDKIDAVDARKGKSPAGDKAALEPGKLGE
jgi:hypothetical protein